MKFAAIAVIASVNAFDVTQTVDELMEVFDTRLTELIDANDFESQDMVDGAMDVVDSLSTVDEGLDFFCDAAGCGPQIHKRYSEPLDEAMDHMDLLGAIDEVNTHVDMLAAIDEGLNQMEDPINEALDHMEMFAAIDDTMAHADLLTAIDETMQTVELMSFIDNDLDTFVNSEDNVDGLDEALNTMDMMASMDEMTNVADMLDAIDEGLDTMTATPVDEALDTMDMLNGIDEALSTIDGTTNLMGEDNIDELIAALPAILDEIDQMTAPKSNTMLYTIIGSVAALLAIGGGLIIKQRFYVENKDDHFESLL